MMLWTFWNITSPSVSSKWSLGNFQIRYLMFQKQDRHSYIAKPGNVDDWKYYLTTIASTKTYATSGMNKLSSSSRGVYKYFLNGFNYS